MHLTGRTLAGVTVGAVILGLAGWGVARTLRDTRAQAEAQAPKLPVPEENGTMSTESTDKTNDLPKTEAEWKARLTDLQYYVTRQKGTERPYTGEYWNTKTAGTYKCIGCGEPLFTSQEKFDSHCGWPSFYQPIGGVKDTRVAEHRDTTAGMVRTEVTCHKCGAHLGHVFNDAPDMPSGLRYCINSASLKLEPKQEGEPAAAEAPAKPK